MCWQAVGCPSTCRECRFTDEGSWFKTPLWFFQQALCWQTPWQTDNSSNKLTVLSSVIVLSFLKKLIACSRVACLAQCVEQAIHMLHDYCRGHGLNLSPNLLLHVFPLVFWSFFQFTCFLFIVLWKIQSEKLKDMLQDIMYKVFTTRSQSTEFCCFF